MLIKEKLGNIHHTPDSRNIDVLIIEWYEANKRILHKQTKSGENVTLKFLHVNPNLKDGDILWQDNDTVIVIAIKPCLCIVFIPDTPINAFSFCYEIGNRHLPLFYEEDKLLIPYEESLNNLLHALGYQFRVEERKLNNAIKTTVFPHSITGTGISIFNKIVQPATLSSLLHLLHLCDSALPIGGFSHSAGLETYVQEEIIKNKWTAKEFVIQQLSQNICYTDAALVSLSYDAACRNDIQTILHLDELCTAVKLPEEIRLASKKLGTRLLKIFENNEAFIFINKYKANIRSQQAFGHYCIAFGLLAHALDIDKQEALSAFYYNAANSMIINAVKLVPLGQQDGQEILMSVFALISELVQQSILPDKEMIGFCCAGFDVRCMQHEQLYSRLYMS